MGARHAIFFAEKTQAFALLCFGVNSNSNVTLKMRVLTCGNFTLEIWPLIGSDEDFLLGSGRKHTSGFIEDIIG